MDGQCSDGEAMRSCRIILFPVHNPGPIQATLHWTTDEEVDLDLTLFQTDGRQADRQGGQRRRADRAAAWRRDGRDDLRAAGHAARRKRRGVVHARLQPAELALGSRSRTPASDITSEHRGSRPAPIPALVQTITTSGPGRRTPPCSRPRRSLRSRADGLASTTARQAAMGCAHSASERPMNTSVGEAGWGSLIIMPRCPC